MKTALKCEITYKDHYPFTNANGTKRINCKSGSNLNPTSTGVCANVHPWPTAETFLAPVETTHFTATGGCDGVSCLTLVSSNYQTPSYTWGDALVYAEKIRTAWNGLTGFELSPIVTSGWRNPERNETITKAVINSNHQWGAAIDVQPDDGDSANVPAVYNPSNPDEAATTWCTLAAAADAVGNAIEIHIENTRTNSPSGIDQIYTSWGVNSTIQTCVDALRPAMVQCVNFWAGLTSVNARCSPNHVHTAR